VKPIARPYAPEDFQPVRDMLVETWSAHQSPVNWDIARWNWCRYSGVPYLVNWPRNLSPTPAESLAGIAWWEAHLAVWEDGGRIVALVHTESTHLGECWIEHRPGYGAILPDALAWAEAHLADEGGWLRVWAADRDPELVAALVARGYRCRPEEHEPASRFSIGTPTNAELPAGFAVASMAEGGDAARRAECIGRGFGHADPRDWSTPAHYRELLRAPDYDPSLDLHVIAPDGRYVSIALLWHDQHNHVGLLEPVATHPDFRRQGLGRAVIYEGIRRVAARGATQVWVGSDQLFYRAIGFRVCCYGHAWSRPLESSG
jgi:predicted N-acetyltransferase YhbS